MSKAQDLELLSLGSGPATQPLCGSDKPPPSLSPAVHTANHSVFS